MSYEGPRQPRRVKTRTDVEPVDHELLLRKYIRYVQEHEGAGYIIPHAVFSDQEYAELQRQEDLAYPEGESAS